MVLKAPCHLLEQTWNIANTCISQRAMTAGLYKIKQYFINVFGAKILVLSLLT